jgi:glycosyltransferase involved in cell wall biosynthesis
MHIGFLCNEYPPVPHGGIGTFTQTMARALVQQGHQVTVVGIHRGEASREDDRGVGVYRLPFTPTPKLSFWINGGKLRRQLRAIHRQSPFTILDAPENGYAFAHLRGVYPHVVRMHGGHRFLAHTLGRPTQRIKRWIEQRSFRRATDFCAVSRFVAETTRRLAQLGNRDIAVLHNPVDVGTFRPHPEIDTVPGRILFLGTVNENKGVRQLIQAFPQIADAVPAAHLKIVGRDGRDPKTGGSFTATVQNLLPDTLRERVEWVNYMEHSRVPAFMATAELAVFPSHIEAQGIVAVESMAMGKPTVFSRTGPGAEIIEDGSNGLLCDPHDPASIASCAIRLLLDAALRDAMGKRARAKAETDFAVEHLVERNLEFYRRCLG